MDTMPAKDAVEQALPQSLADAIDINCPDVDWEALWARLQADQVGTLADLRALFPRSFPDSV